MAPSDLRRATAHFTGSRTVGGGLSARPLGGHRPTHSAALDRERRGADTWRAMSQENVELALRTFDAVSRRDLNALLALMDDDVEVVTRIAAMEGGLRGRAGIRRWWENMFAAFPDFEFEVVDVRDLGDVTLASLRSLGHGAGSDVPFEDLLWHASQWRRGKCVWWRAFETETDALEAVGLRE
jgi:ketosteroid isomerase-like protein